MHQLKAFRRMAGLGLMALFTVVCLAGAPRLAQAAGPGADGPSATPQPWEWSSAVGPDGASMAMAPAMTALNFAPEQPAETFTSRVFWIVLALVVLGSIILIADFPDTN